MHIYRCLARSTRCKTMSHSPPMRRFYAHLPREAPDATPYRTSPPQGVRPCLHDIITANSVLSNTNYITIKCITTKIYKYM